MTFNLKKAINGEFYFIMKAGNGKTLVTSETYPTKSACKKGIKSIRVKIFDCGLIDETEVPELSSLKPVSDHIPYD